MSNADNEKELRKVKAKEPKPVSRPLPKHYQEQLKRFKKPSKAEQQSALDAKRMRTVHATNNPRIAYIFTTSLPTHHNTTPHTYVYALICFSVCVCV